MTVVTKKDNLQIDKMSLGPFGTNCYIVTCLETKECVVVDAPAETETIVNSLKDANVKYILMTHNHMDHTGALAELHSWLGVTMAANEADSGGLPVKPDIYLSDGDILSVGKLAIKVIHTPGHTPGGLCFLTGKYLLSGDTVFNDGPGRTSSPNALKQLIESITTKIFILPDDTEIFPGHGESTVLRDEKARYAVFASKTHESDLCGDIVWTKS
jgi:hydroxyacylglutathione hydrolase